MPAAAVHQARSKKRRKQQSLQIIMAPDHKIKNAFKRSEQFRKSKREKGQEKLKRRMEVGTSWSSADSRDTNRVSIEQEARKGERGRRGKA